MIAPAGRRRRRRPEADGRPASAARRAAVAKSQDAPGPIARTVADAATRRSSVADAGTTATRCLAPTALTGKRVAVIDSARRRRTRPRSPRSGRGRDDGRQDDRDAEPNAPSIVTREFETRPQRLPRRQAGRELAAGIIDYNTANPVEGLKYQQGQLIGGAVDRTSPALRRRHGRGQGGERRASSTRLLTRRST